MFFILSKAVWPLVTPASLGILALLAGVLLHRACARTSRALLVFAAGLFLVFGIFPVGPDSLHHLEHAIPRPAVMPRHVDGILVLGGAVETRASAITLAPELNDGADRVTTGLMLARRYPGAKLVFSGGDGRLLHRDIHDDAPQESAMIKKLVAGLGLPAKNIIYETRSRNTFENLRYSREMLKPAPGEVWILITSAYHMPRSMAIAERLGWNLIPYPVDYRGPGYYVFWPERYDVPGTLFMSDLALREWVGILAYRLTGKL